jgi:hypothetical protein
MIKFRIYFSTQLLIKIVIINLFLWKFNDPKIKFKIQWLRKKMEIRWRGEKNGGRKNIKKKDHRGYTEILFSTHSVLLKRS